MGIKETEAFVFPPTLSPTEYDIISAVLNDMHDQNKAAVTDFEKFQKVVERIYSTTCKRPRIDWKSCVIKKESRAKKKERGEKATQRCRTRNRRN